MDDRSRLTDVLLANTKRECERLAKLLEEVNGHWSYGDGLYRFYHQSFKVYYLQEHAQQIVAALRAIAPENQPFCGYFEQLLSEGTGRTFTQEANANWLRQTAPIVQAFFHARYFLEVAVKYARELEAAPQMMPSGFAALLCLYDIR
ncbi:MAG: hypothetical protein WD042_13525 [Phycisphaeraceae bacterium]